MLDIINMSDLDFSFDQVSKPFDEWVLSGDVRPGNWQLLQLPTNSALNQCDSTIVKTGKKKLYK